MDEWDVFKGKKYIVSGLDCFGENLKNIEDSGPDDRDGNTIVTNNPREAIKQWFILSKKYPTMVDIMTKTKANGCELLKEATAEYLTELYEEYGSCYKLEYLIKEAEDNLSRSCKYLYESEYGDSIHPFCCG